MLRLKLSRLNVRKAVTVFLVVLWVSAMAAGTHFGLRWESTPGGQPKVLRQGPMGKRWELLMVAHPSCPCTQASLGNLSELRAHASVDLGLKVIFVSDRAEETETVRQARAVRGTTVEFTGRPDDKRIFGATTSGQVFLLDPQGNVRFAGGITDGRGNPERSAGIAAIESILKGGPDAKAPVYGCALFAQGGVR